MTHLTCADALRLAREAVEDDKSATDANTYRREVQAYNARTREPQLARWVKQTLNVTLSAFEEMFVREQLARLEEKALPAYLKRALAAALLRAADDVEVEP